MKKKTRIRHHKTRFKKEFVHVCAPATASQIRKDLGITKSQQKDAERALKQAGVTL